MEKYVVKLVVCLIGLVCVITGCDQVDDVTDSIGQVVETQLDEMRVEISDIVKEAVSEAVQNEKDAITAEVSNFVGSVEEKVGLSEGEEQVEVEDENLVEVIVFYPDSQVEYFLEEGVYIPKTGDWVQEVMQALVKKGIIPEEVVVNQYVVEQMCLTIWLSEEFEEFINQFGTSGEYMYMGSVVNTLLIAGELEEVEIRIGEGYLETGHAIYDMPLGWFEDTF